MKKYFFPEEGVEGVESAHEWYQQQQQEHSGGGSSFSVCRRLTPASESLH